MEVLEKVGVVDVRVFFTKELDRGMNGAVVMSWEKPVKISINTTSLTASIKAHYQVTNEFGILI